MSKPFPPPPFQNNRQPREEPSPFGRPDPHHIEDDPRLTDPEIIFAFKQYLRPDQHYPEMYKFILAYVVNRNAAQAAREAGLKGNGGYWRARPEVHACIEAITAMAVLKHGYDANEVVERAKEIANIDPIEFQNPDGSFKTHMSEIRPEARRAIKKFRAKNIYGEDANGMKTVIGQLIEVEMWDKLKGIELLGSEKNVFKKTTVVQHDVTNNMKDVLLDSSNRAEERMRLLNAREVGGDETGDTESGGGEQSWSGDGVPIGEPGGEGIGD